MFAHYDTFIILRDIQCIMCKQANGSRLHNHLNTSAQNTCKIVSVIPLSASCSCNARIGGCRQNGLLVLRKPIQLAMLPTLQTILIISS